MSDTQSHVEIKGGTERGFGLVFAAFFAIVATWPLLGGSGPRWWALAAALAFAVTAFVAPQVLRPANALWTRLSILLGRIVGPIVMALIFFLAVTPTALVIRLLGRDLLRLKLDPDADSYWIVRDTAVTQSMRKQF